MRHLRTILLLLLLVGCAAPAIKRGRNAAQTDLSQYKGKRILQVDYCEGCGQAGDLLIIQFTDKTRMVVYAYKYNMKIY